MKRMVVTNRRGDIIATGPYFDEYVERKAKDGGPPIHHAFIPLRGQQVHVVEFPDEASSDEAISRFHKTHRVRVIRGKAELERRGKNSSRRAPKRKSVKSRRSN